MSSFFLPNWSPPDDPARPLPAEGRPWPSDDDDDDDDDDDGYPAYSHHDKIPPWWGNVSNDEGGNVSVSKTHHTPS